MSSEIKTPSPHKEKIIAEQIKSEKLENFLATVDSVTPKELKEWQEYRIKAFENLANQYLSHTDILVSGNAKKALLMIELSRG